MSRAPRTERLPIAGHSPRTHRVKNALDLLFESCPRERIAAQDLKLVVLSDLHRGKRDRSDDFLGCEESYGAALSSYLNEDWKLFLLGDVEELWEVDASSALDSYSSLLELEAAFLERGGLQRFFGNHDDLWQFKGAVEQRLAHYLTRADETRSDQLVLEGLVLEITNLLDGKTGVDLRILFAHGHQGSTLGDGLAPMARMFVRHLWRPIQRLTRINTTSLSQDYRLRNKHEISMSTWAAQRRNTLLVTGHTHHPVFSGEGHETELQREILELDALIDQTRDSQDLHALGRRLGELKVELEARLNKTDGVALDIYESNPAYFNSGCCCYRSGSITGIELEGDSIALVRWRRMSSGRGIERDVLRRDRLSAVLARSPMAG